MYNRYISDRRGDENFVPASSPQQEFQHTIPLQQSIPVTVELPANGAAEAVVPASSQHKSFLDGLFGKGDGKTGLFGGLFGGFNLKDLDLGDIILILILILLVIDGDDWDFLITVGLIVLLGL
jgi:hypothetical protein